MRLKILLAILVVLVVGFGIFLMFYWPSSEASTLNRGGWKRIARSSSPTATSTPMPTSIVSPSTLFFDDFAGTLAKWQTVYDGYGTVGIENGLLSMAPKASTTAAETHAPLVMAGSAWGDITYTVRMNTISQLRTGSLPNPWEVGWILFRMQDASHSYYFAHKPNGIEMGKYIPGAPYQYFLYGTENPKLTLNTWNTYKIATKGANIKVWINNTQVIDYTEPTDGSKGTSWYTGKIGLYNEDSHVHYDDVVVTSN